MPYYNVRIMLILQAIQNDERVDPSTDNYTIIPASRGDHLRGVGLLFQDKRVDFRLMMHKTCIIKWLKLLDFTQDEKLTLHQMVILEPLTDVQTFKKTIPKRHRACA